MRILPVLPAFVLGLVTVLLLSAGPVLAAAEEAPVVEIESANMMPFDFNQPGQFTAQIPWRLSPEAKHCPLLVHAFLGYTWVLQQQIDLLVKAIDVEIGGKLYDPQGKGHTFVFEGDEQVVRKAGSSRQFWYRIFQLPAELFAVDARTTVRIKLHRAGRSARALVPVPPSYNRPPDMRVKPDRSPYEGEEPGWFLQSIYRSSKPLPGFAGFRGGDTHVHTEYTHSAFEYGGPIEAYAAAARAMGLDWAAFTDHGHSFDSQENLDLFNRGATYPPFEPRHGKRIQDKWNEFVHRTRELARTPGRPFLPIVGAEIDVRAPSNQGLQYFAHALVYGLSQMIPAEGPNGVDVKLGPVTVRHGEHGFSGHSDIFDRDTLSLDQLLKGLKDGRFGDAYGRDGLVVHLSHPINKYDKFFPNQLHIGHWWRWGFDDEPNELPAYYEPAPDRLPVTGFQVFNSNTIPYSEEVDPSIPYWDSILCEGLRFRPPRRNTIVGGTDTHNDLNSTSLRPDEYNLNYLKFFRKPDGDGFGSVRTLVACPGSPTERDVLKSLQDGCVIVTNGPAVLAGFDTDGDGRLTAGRDVLPSIREGSGMKLSGSGQARVLVTWNSTPEFGAVEEVRLLLGKTTGATVAWTGRPEGAAGFDGQATVELDASSLSQWSYVRAECVTRKGQDVMRDGRLQWRLERRAYANPVWLERVD